MMKILELPMHLLKYILLRGSSFQDPLTDKWRTPRLSRDSGGRVEAFMDRSIRRWDALCGVDVSALCSSSCRAYITDLDLVNSFFVNGGAGRAANFGLNKAYEYMVDVRKARICPDHLRQQVIFGSLDTVRKYTCDPDVLNHRVVSETSCAIECARTDS